jgi:hypothetical protein
MKRAPQIGEHAGVTPSEPTVLAAKVVRLDAMFAPPGIQQVIAADDSTPTGVPCAAKGTRAGASGTISIIEQNRPEVEEPNRAVAGNGRVHP